MRIFPHKILISRQLYLTQGIFDSFGRSIIENALYAQRLCNRLEYRESVADRVAWGLANDPTVFANSLRSISATQLPRKRISPHAITDAISIRFIPSSSQNTGCNMARRPAAGSASPLWVRRIWRILLIRGYAPSIAVPERSLLLPEAHLQED